MAVALNRELMESLAGFSVAPELERRCLFVIAARTDPLELEQYRFAFNVLDKNRSGRIMRMELVDGLRAAASWCTVRVNADSLFNAADLDCTGMISFTEFAAACLHNRLAPLDSWLAQQAFESMDCNSDGLLSAQQVRAFFGKLPAGLPHTRSFDLQEWCECLLSSGGSKGPASARKASAAVGLQRQFGGRLNLFGLFDGCRGCQKENDPLEANVARNYNFDWSGEPETIEVQLTVPLPPPPPVVSLEAPPASTPRVVNATLPSPLKAAYNSQQEDWRWRLPSMQDNHRFGSSQFLSSPTYVPASAL